MSEYLYENAYDMIDVAVDEHLETEEDIIFDAKDDERDNDCIDALISEEDEKKALEAIAIEDAYERSQEEDEEEDDESEDDD